MRIKVPPESDVKAVTHHNNIAVSNTGFTPFIAYKTGWNSYKLFVEIRTTIKDKMFKDLCLS